LKSFFKNERYDRDKYENVFGTYEENKKMKYGHIEKSAKYMRERESFSS
jgi:hypothetical protein